MSRFTGTDAANLREAYASMYKQVEEPVIVLNEEGDYITEEFLNEQADIWIAKLIEEDFNIEEHTLEELTEMFINYSIEEGWAQDLGANIRQGINRGASAVGGAVSGAARRVGKVVRGAANRASDRIGAAAQGLTGQRTTSRDAISRGANLATRVATSGVRATGDFVRGLATGQKGAQGPQKNIGTDIAGGLKKAGSALNKVSGGLGAKAAGAAKAAGGVVAGAGAKAAEAGSKVGQVGGRAGSIAARKAPADDGGRQAWLDKTRNSPAARAGFSDDERWALQQKHRQWKANRGGGNSGNRTVAGAATQGGRPAMRTQSFDWEDQNLVEQASLEMFLTIATSMIYEGHTTQDVVKFVQEHDNFDIVEVVEKVLYGEETITESTVSEEFINEQLEQLDEVVGALLRVGGALLKGARFAKGAKGIAPLARLGGSLKGGGTALSRIATQGIGKSSVVRSGLAKTATGMKGLVGKTSTKNFAKTLGTGALGGFVGAKIAGGGNKGSSAGTATPGQKTPGQSSGQKTDQKVEKAKKTSQYKANYNTPSSRSSVSNVKRTERAPNGTLVTVPDGYKWNPKTGSYRKEAYDIVLEHLLSTKQVENVDEALYVMSEMDSDAIQAIVNKE